MQQLAPGRDAADSNHAIAISAGIKRCAIYTRKSPGRDEEQDYDSLDAQRDAGREYLRRDPGRILIDRRYDDDGYSGKTLDRPALQRLLADIDAGLIDVVIVYKSDRLTRNSRDAVLLADRFAAAGTRVVSVTDPVGPKGLVFNFGTADAVERFCFQILMAHSELERAMISQRTHDKIRAARLRGMWTGGLVPLGYDLEHKHLLIEEHGAEIVRELFELFDAEKRSPTEIAQTLNDRGLAIPARLTRTGRTLAARPWLTHDVVRVLQNPIYAGLVSIENALVPGQHRALVSHDVFERVREALGHRQRPRGRAHNRTYLLHGLFVCGRCGSAMTAGSAAHHGAREYRYYRCAAHVRYGAKRCSATAVRADAIERMVVDRLRGAIAGAALAQEVATAAAARILKQRDHLRTARRSLPRRIGRFADDRRRLVERFDSLPSAERLPTQQRIAILDEQIALYQQQQATADRMLDRIQERPVDAKWVARCLTSFDELWNVMSPEQRCRLVRSVVARVELSRFEHEVKIHLVNLTRSPQATNVVACPLYRRPSGLPFDSERHTSSCPARVARMLALAHSIQTALDAGGVVYRSDVARRFRVTGARITQLLDLLYLATDLQERVLFLETIDGSEPVTEHAVRKVARVMDWRKQREAFAALGIG